MKKIELIKKIRKEFPKLKWKKAQHNVQGWDHYVIILDEKYVFRFPRTKHYQKILRREIPLLNYLAARTNVPIPQYTYIAKDKSFAGYEMIKGEQFTKVRFDKLSQRTKSLIAKQLALFLTKLHQISITKVQKFGVKNVKPQKLYGELTQETKKYVIPRMTKKEKSLIISFLRDFKKYLKFPNKVFTHSDLYIHHIILAKNKKSLAGVIDFGDVLIDDPARDFTELWLYGSKFVEEVYRNYKGPKDRDFLRRSIMYYKRMPLWVMIYRLKGRSGKFKAAYKMFKEIFKAEYI